MEMVSNRECRCQSKPGYKYTSLKHLSVSFAVENISYEQKNCLYKLLKKVGVNGDTHSNSSVYLKEYLQIFFTGV